MGLLQYIVEQQQSFKMMMAPSQSFSPLLFFLLFLLPLSVSSLPDTFLPGPYTVDHVHFNKEIFGSLDHAIEVYAPNTPGPKPVFMFFTGLSGAAPGWAYSTLLKHVASFGYVVISPWAIVYNPADSYKADWVQPLLDWSAEHLAPGVQPDLNPELELDLSQLHFGSHSSGGHVAVEFLKKGCSDVKSLTLLSPVDGLDPFGLVPIYCITPGEMLNFRTPTLIVAGGLDTIPGLGFGPACAPVELGSDRFYNAMAGPTLILNTTQFGHADLLDELEAGANEIIKFCKADPDSDKYSYRVELGGQLVSFLTYVNEGRCDLWDYMSGVEVSGTGVLLEHQWKGGAEATCGSPGCQWTEPNL